MSGRCDRRPRQAGRRSDHAWHRASADRDQGVVISRQRSCPYTPGRFRSRAERPSASGHSLESRDADRQSRPGDKGRPVSPASPLRRVLRNIRPDELEQHSGHVLAFGGGNGLKAIVQRNGNIEIHSFHLLFCWLADLPHPLPGDELIWL